MVLATFLIFKKYLGLAPIFGTEDNVVGQTSGLIAITPTGVFHGQPWRRTEDCHGKFVDFEQLSQSG